MFASQFSNVSDIPAHLMGPMLRGAPAKRGRLGAQGCRKHPLTRADIRTCWTTIDTRKLNQSHNIKEQSDTQD